MSQDLLTALKGLYRAYVVLLENGRDRIVSLGGQCDIVTVMEDNDPVLIRVRAVIAQAEKPPSHPDPNGSINHDCGRS